MKIMNIKIYQSTDKLSVLFQKGTDPIETHPTRSFSIVPLGDEIKFEFASGRVRTIPFANIEKGDGTSAGATIQEVLAYLDTFTNDNPVSNTGVLDRLGRSKTSSATPLFNNKQTLGKDATVWDEVILGGGTSVFDADNSSVELTVTTNGDAVIRQTKQRVPYQTGAPVGIDMTGRFSTPTANLLQRIGYFSNNTRTTPYNSDLDGYWYEMDGLTPYFVVSRSGTETLRVDQSNWNVDKLDGTGASGITIDWTKSQIFSSSFLWLGVDGISFGFKIKDRVIVAHELEWSNDNVGVYMTSPNQPLRYEIRSTGGSGTMIHTCVAANSNDGVRAAGRTITTRRDIEDSFFALDDQYNPLIAVRLKEGSKNESYKLIKSDILSTSSANGSWLISINPQLQLNGSDVTWDSRTEWTDVPNSGLEVCKFNDVNYRLNPNDLGILLESGYVANNTDGVVTQIENEKRIGVQIDGSQVDRGFEVLVLAVNPQANETFYAGLTFKGD